MSKLKYSAITSLILFLFIPLFAVDTLHCIANYEFQSPIDELEILNIRPLGDVNVDGYDDWAYIFRDRNPFSPDDTAWVFFGCDTIDFTCDHILRTRDIAPVGDVNNDGFQDIAYLVVELNNMYIVSTPKLYILYGGEDFDFVPDDTCIVNAGGQHAEFSPIGTVGDINGDGYDDIYSGVYNQINAEHRVKNYIHFGSEDISSTPNVTLYPPPNIDTYTEEVYKWGEYYSSIGDVNNDGYNDFSLLFASRPPYTDYPRVLYTYMGNSSSDSIISSVDTLVSGFYTDFYQTCNTFGEENGIMLCDEYLHYIDIFSVESLNTLHRFNSAQKVTESCGDINNDGYPDWILLFENPLLYQGYFGNSILDTIADFYLPADNKPTAIYPRHVTSSFIGDICGDGYDKLLVVESSKSFPSTTPTTYSIFCYSYNEVLTSTASSIPTHYTIHPNYPNPFNPTTTIEFAIPEAQNIKLQIFDITGRLVETLVDGFKEAGNWDMKWDASDQSSGIYIYTLEYGDKHISRKMLLIK